MNERYRQTDGRIVEWPTLQSAEKLDPLGGEEARRVKVLALHEKRRISNMPPPSVREMSEYIGGISTSVVTYMLNELVEKEYLNKLNTGDKIATRGTTIKVDFQTIKLKNGKFANITDFPDIEGLTSPIIKNS